METNLSCGATRRRSWILAAAAALAAAGAASPTWAQRADLARSSGEDMRPQTRAARWRAQATPQEQALHAFAQNILRDGTHRQTMGLPPGPKVVGRQDKVARGAARNAERARGLLIEALAAEALQTRRPIRAGARTDKESLRELESLQKFFNGHATRAIKQRTAAVAGDRVLGLEGQGPVEVRDGLADGVRVYLRALRNGRAHTPGAAGGDAQSTVPKHGRKPSEVELRVAAADMAKDLMDSHIGSEPFALLMFPGTTARTSHRSESTPGTDE